MSVTPSGSNILVQTKPDKPTLPTVAETENASKEVDTVTSTPPVSPIEPIPSTEAADQESQTHTLLLPQKTPASQEKTKLEIQTAVDKLNNFMSSMKRDLEFHFDSDLKKTVVTVRDSATQEVVRQLPSEAALKLAEVLQDNTHLDNTHLTDSTLGQLLDVKT